MHMNSLQFSNIFQVHLFDAFKIEKDREMIAPTSHYYPIAYCLASLKGRHVPDLDPNSAITVLVENLYLSKACIRLMQVEVQCKYSKLDRCKSFNRKCSFKCLSHIYRILILFRYRNAI